SWTGSTTRRPKGCGSPFARFFVGRLTQTCGSHAVPAPGIRNSGVEIGVPDGPLVTGSRRRTSRSPFFKGATEATFTPQGLPVVTSTQVAGPPVVRAAATRHTPPDSVTHASVLGPVASPAATDVM